MSHASQAEGSDSPHASHDAECASDSADHVTDADAVAATGNASPATTTQTHSIRREVIGAAILSLTLGLGLALLLASLSLSEQGLELASVLLLTLLPSIAIPTALNSGRRSARLASDGLRLVAVFLALVLAALLALGWAPAFFFWLLTLCVGWFGITRMLFSCGVGKGFALIACASLMTALCTSMWWADGALHSLESSDAAVLAEWMRSTNPWLSASAAYADADLLVTTFLYFDVTTRLNDYPPVLESSVLTNQMLAWWLIGAAGLLLSLLSSPIAERWIAKLFRTESPHAERPSTERAP